MSESEREMDFRAALLLLWSRRRTVVLVTLSFIVAAAVWQIAWKKTYKATVQMSLVSEKSGLGGQLSSIIGQLGPLGSLVGSAALGGGSEAESEALATLQSRVLTQKFLQDHDLMPVLFASRWDAARKAWKPDYFRKDPTLWDGVLEFQKHRKVAQDGKTSLVMLTVTWRDAAQAASWANELVALSNAILQKREIDEAQTNIAYLTDQMPKAVLVEVRTALSGLIQAETKRQMLASGRKDFALRVIDPAVVPERPSSPGLIISVFCGALAGFVVAIFVLLVADSLKSRS